MTDTPLIYEKDYENRRACLTFNRPEVMNAINPEMSVALRDAIEDFNNDPDLWVAIITGAGDRAFCAGADLGSTIPNETNASRSQPLTISEDRPFHGIYKPILAAVNGYCIAGGLEVMLGTDIRVAAETAEFGLQEVRWGIVPSAGSHIRLPRQIPWAWAMELLAHRWPHQRPASGTVRPDQSRCRPGPSHAHRAHLRRQNLRQRPHRRPDGQGDRRAGRHGNVLGARLRAGVAALHPGLRQ